MSQGKLPKAWRLIKLGEVVITQPGTSEFTKSDYVQNGYPAYSAAGQDGFLRTFRHSGSAIILSSIGAQCGKCFFSSGRWTAIANTQILWPQRNVVPEFLFYLLNYYFEWPRVGSAQPFITVSEAKERQIPLPPLPVQERIVQILQKADEIRRKRREALETVEAVRCSLFVEMFGDAGSNPKGWPTAPLNELLDPAIERINPSSAFPDQEFTYIEIAGVKDFRIAEVKRLRGAEAPSRARQVVRTGDVLYSMTRPNLRNIAMVPEEYDGAICTTGFAVLRPKNPDDSAFIFEIVKGDHFTETMSRLAEAKSLYPAVDEGQVRQLRVIQPSPPLRSHFGRVIAHLFGLGSSAYAGAEISQAVFESLLARAFTGELTAEWEAANAKEIAAQQALHERLPRLLVLALLVEKAKRANRAVAEVLVTALMKYAFLLQMEGNGGRRRLYHFVPYHYGPFAKELYTDLQALQQEGLVRVESDSEEDRTKITLVDPAKANEALAALPDDLKEDAAAIIETYGSLDHNALLRTVYEKYPAYAKKSRLRRTRGAGQPPRSRGRMG
jgi:type I restriction enzyme S subunit